MVDSPTTDITGLRHSPLEPLAEAMREGSVDGARGVSLREIPFLAMAGIRVSPGTGAAEALCDVVGLDLPAGPGDVSGATEATALLWQGPDEFLLVAPDETVVPAELADHEREPGALPSLSTHPLIVRLARVLAESGARGQVVDLSANQTTLELSGPSARATLEKGCPMDLHPREFPVGRAVSTTLGPVQVLLWRTGEQQWRIMPRASFAQYTAQWLLDAMIEFGSPEIP